MAKMLGQDILTQVEFDEFYQNEFLANKALLVDAVVRCVAAEKVMKWSIAANAVLVIIGGILLYVR